MNFEETIKLPTKDNGEKKETDPKNLFPKSPKEEILESNEKESSNDLLGSGTNKTIFIQLRDDGSGIFKPKSGEAEGSRIGIEAGTYFKRERAAYLVDRFFRLGLVPPTVIREIDSELGSLQEFIPDTTEYFGLDDKERKEIEQSVELLKLFILDYIIFNSDRHTQNILIKNKELYAIDNGLAFGKAYFRFWPKKPFNKPIPQEIQESLFDFSVSDKEQSALRDLLSELLSPAEIDACLARIEFIVRLIVRYGMIPNDTELKFDPSINY